MVNKNTLFVALLLLAAVAAPALANKKAETESAKPKATQIALNPEDALIAQLKEGFRGAPWGMKKSDMKALGVFDCKQMDALIENCGAENALLKIDTVPLLLLRYKFVDEVFFGVAMKYELKHADMVKGLVSRELGQPTDFSDNIPHWKNDVFDAWLSNTHFVVDAKKPLEDAIAKRKK